MMITLIMTIMLDDDNIDGDGNVDGDSNSDNYNSSNDNSNIDDDGNANDDDNIDGDGDFDGNGNVDGDGNADGDNIDDNDANGNGDIDGNSIDINDDDVDDSNSINDNNNHSEYNGKIYYTDEEREMGIDPFQGYTYTDNTSPDRKGEGFLGETLRFSTKPGKQRKGNQIAFYKSGWHMSSFLPNIGNFMNKFQSYSHYNEFKKLSNEEKKKKIIERIRSHRYIFGGGGAMPTIDTKIPETEEEKIPSLYSYEVWKKIQEEYKKKGKSSTLDTLNKHVLHEMPRQVWENPICYSYMIDRDFGLSKNLWWEVIPKEDWSTVDFNELEKEKLEKIKPLNKKK